jgi:hypothetical protein
MNLLKKLLPEFTYNELIERIIEEEIYLNLDPSSKYTKKRMKQLKDELSKRYIKKIRKQKLEKINNV